MQIGTSLLLLLITLFLIIGGCAPTLGDRIAFRNMMDDSVGRKEINYTALESVADYGERIRKVIKYSESNCSFYVDIDKPSGKTLAWGYLSDPGNCYLETNYLGPW